MTIQDIFYIATFMTRFVKETIEKYGKPKKILVDNDKRFAENLKNGAGKRVIEIEHIPLIIHRQKEKLKEQ